MLLAAGGIAVTGGCGGSSDEGQPDRFAGEQGEVADVVDEYSRALAGKDARRVCELTYLEFPPDGGRDRPLKGSELEDCVKEGAESLGEGPRAAKPELEKVEVTNDRASAELRPPDDAAQGAPPPTDLRLRKFDGEWKVSFEPK